MYTIEEAKKYLRDNFESGASCPCCGQLVKLYTRRITSSQAQALLMVSRYFKEHPRKQYVHVEEFDFTAFRGGDFAKLRYWGLIEQSANKDSAKKDSGLWKLTPKGHLFVAGQTTVPSYAKLFNGKITEYAADRISIEQALGHKFDYHEVMNDPLPSPTPPEAVPVLLKPGTLEHEIAMNVFDH